MKVKEILSSKKIVITTDDRYRPIHLEYGKTVIIEEGDDADAIDRELNESIDANLAVRAVEARFGNRFSKDRLSTLSKIEAAEKEVNNFLDANGLGHCKIEL